MRRYTITSTGYKHDKIIYYTAFMSIITIAIIIMALNNFDFTTHPYIQCNYETCMNPYYQQPCQQALTIFFTYRLYTTTDCRIQNNNSWINQEFLQKGTYGHKPKANFLFSNFDIISLLILVGALLVNHLFHNKNKKLDFEFKITKNKKVCLQEIIRRLEHARD